jgi:hypothetical protein
VVTKADLETLDDTTLIKFRNNVVVPPELIDLNFNSVRAVLNTAVQYLIDKSVEVTVENVFSVAQQFTAGIKTNLIESLTTNANIVINNGTAGIYKNSVASSNKLLTESEVAALITTGSDVVDRDYGDITVSALGQTWTIDANAVTQSKIGYTFTTISSNTTATNNTYYLCDTSGGAFTLTFPSSASAGHKIYIADLEGTFNTNRLTVARNGLNIENQATDLVLDIKNFTGTFYYVDATIGWKSI